MKLVDLSCVLIKETEKAWCLDIGEKDLIWLPKSQCEIEVDQRGIGTVTLPEWLAMEKGCI